MGACNSHFPFTRHKPSQNTTPDASTDITRDETSQQNATYRQDNHVHSNLLLPSEQVVTSRDLYNILNDSGIRPFIHDPMRFLVLDCRDVDAYTSSHVVTAHHYITFMDNPRLRDELPNYTIIVLYGDVVTENDPAAAQVVLDAVKAVEEYVACDIVVLKDGYDAFSQLFSYLCTDQIVDSLDDRKLLLCYPSAVIDCRLYQGRGDQARNEVITTTLGITHIVNISEHSNAFPHKIKYLRLPLDDMVSTNLSQHFTETYEFIRDALDNNGRVLVHCNLGISRSSTITLAYLMKSRKCTLLDAYKLLKGVRVAASPNSGFLRQLSEWEGEVLGEKRTDLEQIQKHNERILKTYGCLKR